MAQFNFTVFVDKVESGAKPTTIRAMRKQLPKVGDLAHCFTGMRTKKCRRLMVAPIVEVKLITITEHRIKLGNKWLDAVEQEAVRSWDGFSTLPEMRDYFARTHGLPFKGFWTKWNPKEAI